MREQGLYDWLSGAVPGGLAVVPVAVLFLAFVWFEIKRASGLVGARTFRTGLVAIVLFVVFNFVFFRILMAPPPVPDRILVLPFTAADTSGAWVGRSAAYGMEQMLLRQGFKKKAVVRHRQYTAMSSYPAAARGDSGLVRLARRTGIRYLVSGSVAPDGDGYAFSTAYRDLKKDKLLYRLEERVPGTALPAFNRTAVAAALRHFRLRGTTKEEPVGTTGSAAAYRLLARGRAALERGEYGAAERHFTAAFAADTACAYALLGQGTAVRLRALRIDDAEDRKKTLADAAARLVRAVRRDRNLGEAYLELAWTHIHLEKWNEAENELKIALHHMPTDAQVLYLLSKLHRNRYVNYGFESEGDILERALVLAPVHLDAKLNLIDRYLNRNRKADAARLIDEILSVDPANTRAAVTLSLVYIYKNEWDASISTCRNVLAREPGNPDALYNMGISFKGKAEYDSALAYLGRAAEGGVLNALNYMAVIRESRGELYTAIRLLRERVRRGERGEKWREESRKSLYRLVHKPGVVVDSNFAFQGLDDSPAADSAQVLTEGP